MSHRFKPFITTMSAVLAAVVLVGCDDAPPPAPERSTGSQLGAPVAPAQQRVLSFDTVRIERDGTGVVAGRSPLDALVMLFDRDKQVVSTAVNRRGEWTLVIEKPLAPGNAELTLAARLPNGSVIESPETISVLVSERDEAPVVVATNVEKDDASRVLQRPEPAEGASEGGELLLETVDYSTPGQVILSGRSVSERTIRAYLDNRFIGDGAVDPQGYWRITSREEIAPGDYQLRLDQLDDTGAVRARISLPFTRLSEVFVGSITIKRGDNLWTIARKLYGSGFKYTVIYDANKNQIRDPDLIYPDQIFTLPN